MFVAVYWWRVHPGKEDHFRAAWPRGTDLIRGNLRQLWLTPAPRRGRPLRRLCRMARRSDLGAAFDKT